MYFFQQKQDQLRSFISVFYNGNHFLKQKNRLFTNRHFWILSVL